MFKFNGISSREMKVIIEDEDLFLARALLKYERIEINGRDGAIFNELGYSDIERPIKVQVMDIDKLDDIFSWLNGKGILEYKDRITTAYFYNELSPQRIPKIKVIDFSFIRAPFWYKKDDSFQIVTNEIINFGNTFSRPIIRLEKQESKNVDITIADIQFTYDFGNDNYVEIDCEESCALYDGLNRNRQLNIGFEFPKLNPGKNEISINSGDPIIKIKRGDRWL